MIAAISIFDCCDVCDALLSDDELGAGKRWGHDALCDHCAAGYAEVNPGGDA